MGTSGSDKFSRAQTFTTGNNAAGYTVTGMEVDLDMDSFSGSEAAVISIHAADSDGKPDTQLHTLISAASVSDGLKFFSVPERITMDPGTDYVIMV